jgi:tetratricopeptide (TPR) repeat protein
MPQAGTSQIEHYTTSHLERTPGWKMVFRNARSALYLRDHPRNAANLGRIAETYARGGVPFDPESGFDPDRVLRERPDWAIRHGLVAKSFERLRTASLSAPDRRQRVSALGRVATAYALLGLYEQAIELDAQILAMNPSEVGPRRRLVWCLLRAGRLPEARSEAQRLTASDPLTRSIAEVARRTAGEPPSEIEAWIRRLPLLTPGQLRSIASELPSPPVR